MQLTDGCAEAGACAVRCRSVNRVRLDVACRPPLARCRVDPATGKLAGWCSYRRDQNPSGARQYPSSMTEPVSFIQSLDDYIESFHGRATFSRERMSPRDAIALDEEIRALGTPFCPGSVERQLVTDVVWGRPLDPVKGQSPGREDIVHRSAHVHSRQWWRAISWRRWMKAAPESLSNLYHIAIPHQNHLLRPLNGLPIEPDGALLK